VVDDIAEAARVTEAYRNQVLSKVNTSCLRLAVVTGEYPWHRQDLAADTEFLEAT
jgi:hypothetical protein